MKDHLKNTVYTLAIITMVAFSALSFASSSAAGSKVPTLGTSIRLDQGHFDFQVRFDVQKSAGTNKIAALVANNQLLKKYIPYVRSATYSPAQANGNYIFNLTIGEFGYYFPQTFLCRQTQSPTAWAQDCVEQTGLKSAIMSQAEYSTQCTTAANGATQCEFQITGNMHDVKTFLGSIKAAKVAYNFYLQFTSYAAQIGLIAGNVSPSQTQAKMQTTDYHRVIKDLEGQETTAVNQSATGLFRFQDTSPKAQSA